MAKESAKAKKAFWYVPIVLSGMAILALLSLIFLVRSFLPVTKFEILGNYSAYEEDELMLATGVRLGDKLYDVDCKDAEEKLLLACPYLEEAQVKRVFPNKLRLVLSEKRAAWYVALGGDYYALDTELNVLEESSRNTHLVRAGVPELRLPHVKTAMVGKILEFGESDAEIKYAKELMVQVLGTKFKSRLTLLDMESRFEIYIEVDGKYSVYMGNRENMKLKLEAVEKALQSDKLKDCTSAEIDASDPAVVAIRPQFDYKESNAVEEAEQSEK